MLDKHLTDGKEMLNIQDQPSFLLPKMLQKLKLDHQLLPKLIQMRPLELTAITTKMLTTIISLEIHFLSKLTTARQLLENNLTDGKETQIILDQLNSQPLKTPPKPKLDHQLLLKKVTHNQLIALTAITKQPITLIFQVTKLS
jgi:hypothetical protein